MDRGLHPKAQRDLIRHLRSFQAEIPDCQIIATTHSPYLLDEMQPEEVRVTSLRADGSVACVGINQHREFERWKRSFRTGEMWSMIGEKWVAEIPTTVDKTSEPVVEEAIPS